jgi:hypothetical protein
VEDPARDSVFVGFPRVRDSLAGILRRNIEEGSPVAEVEAWAMLSDLFTAITELRDFSFDASRQTAKKVALQLTSVVKLPDMRLKVIDPVFLRATNFSIGPDLFLYADLTLAPETYEFLRLARTLKSRKLSQAQLVACRTFSAALIVTLLLTNTSLESAALYGEGGFDVGNLRKIQACLASSSHIKDLRLVDLLTKCLEPDEHQRATLHDIDKALQFHARMSRSRVPRS